MTKIQNDGNWYSNVFKAWNGKALGPKPSADMLASIHNLGARPGKQALASAMALRDCGVTAGQIVIACGAPQLNKMRGFITDALLKRVAVPPSSEGHTVYKLEVTAKGKQRIERTVKAKAKADADGEAVEKPVIKTAGKAKGTSKPKAKPVAPATVEQPQQAPQGDSAPVEQHASA